MPRSIPIWPSRVLSLTGVLPLACVWYVPPWECESNPLDRRASTSVLNDRAVEWPSLHSLTLRVGQHPRLHPPPPPPEEFEAAYRATRLGQQYPTKFNIGELAVYEVRIDYDRLCADQAMIVLATIGLAYALRPTTRL
jgi:hypothetical protein